MERNSDPVSENVKLAEHIQMDYPHIVDELAEWSIYLDSSLSVDNSYCVATNLLRCRNISLSSVHPSSLSIPLDDNKSSVCKENSLASFSRVNNLFSISWRKISEVMNKWFPLSPLLVSYAHSRENNCPWLLGYLSSESIQGQALCLVATHWLELMELPNRLQSLNSSSIKEFRQSSDITPFELLQSSSVITAHHESDVNQIVINHSSKITRKWYLSYVDPYPQWRMVSFVSYKPCELLGLDSSTGNSLPPFDNLYYLTAIGYSNGSIDIIDLSVDESEKPDLGQNIQRSRIFIPPPFTQSNCSPSSKKPLFPIVLLTFIDVSHILVGHFRGHVDLWHLDWKAKSFPGRMMMRIYPVDYCKSSLSSPLLSGVFDLSSNLLVLSSLPDIGVSKASKLMHRKLGITCFYVSKKAPYLIPTSSSLMSDTVPRGMNTFYGVCKDLSIQLLCTLFRRNRYLPIENHDAIMSMVLANFNGTSLPTLASSDSCKQLLLGSLHSSGSYSVWLVPSFELLFLIANPERSSSLSMVPSDQISGTHTKAFRIAWWSRPLESNESVNQDVQLSILHENGSIDLLDITKCGTEFYPKVTRKLEGLKLSTFPVFAAHSLLLCSPHANCPSEVVLLSSCLKPSPGNGVTSQDSSSKNQIFNHCVRCTRLKSTTYNGLFEHFLRMGKFQKLYNYAHQVKKIEKLSTSKCGQN
ncbi:unnamed protein product [Heterobilharzia americana]|nr:unnamed protein product [Heterobilharzia americana]